MFMTQTNDRPNARLDDIMRKYGFGNSSPKKDASPKPLVAPVEIPVHLAPFSKPIIDDAFFLYSGRRGLVNRISKSLAKFEPTIITYLDLAFAYHCGTMGKSDYETFLLDAGNGFGNESINWLMRHLKKKQYDFSPEFARGIYEIRK